MPEVSISACLFLIALLTSFACASETLSKNFSFDNSSIFASNFAGSFILLISFITLLTFWLFFFSNSAFFLSNTFCFLAGKASLSTFLMSSKVLALSNPSSAFLRFPASKTPGYCASFFSKNFVATFAFCALVKSLSFLIASSNCAT